MQAQVRNFLLRCGGHASSMAIASTVLQLRNATPALAERVVTSLLKNDPRFASDGLGNWYVAESPAAAGAASPQEVCIAFTPMRTAQIATANRLVLGWSLPPFKATRFLEIVLRAEANPNEEHGNLPTCARADFLRIHFEDFQKGVLLAWNPSAIRAALRRIAASTPEAWLPPTNISLQNLARNLLRLSQKPKLPEVYQRLTGAALQSESWEHQLRAQIEIWEALQSHCEARGLREPQQIAHYSRRALPPDFSQYAFDEKHLERLPETPGVYVMKDRDERVIYVGKAANLRERVRSYFTNDFAGEAKLQEIRARIAQLHFERCETELDALLREQILIKRFRPPLNRQTEVHSQTETQLQKPNGIYLAPVRTALPQRSKGRIVLYLLSPQHLNRLPVNLSRIPKRRLRAVLEKHLHPAAQAEKIGAQQRAQIEIAARWFHHNRNAISTIATHAGDRVEDIETRLLRLLRAPEVFHERVELA